MNCTNSSGTPAPFSATVTYTSPTFQFSGFNPGGTTAPTSLTWTPPTNGIDTQNGSSTNYTAMTTDGQYVVAADVATTETRLLKIVYNESVQGSSFTTCVDPTAPL